MNYLLDLPGLSAAVAGAPVAAKHDALLKAMRKFDQLAGIKLATVRGGIWLQRRKVLDAAGAVVADDHEQWLKEKVAGHGGDLDATAAELRPLGYQLSVCSVEMLYLIADSGGPQDNFVQAEVEIRNERVDRRMFYPSGGWRRLKDLAALIQEAEDGSRVAPEAERAIVCACYHLRKVVDVRKFMLDAEALKAAAHLAQRQRTIEVTEIGMGPGSTPPVQRRMTLDEINPSAKDWVWPPRRLFDDWAASSAGHDGHRISDHWALEITDYTSPQGHRDVSVIPMWTHTRKMAKIDSTLNIHTLFGKLQSIDTRRGAVFAWFFYMLHGNLFGDRVGTRILKAAEDGLIVLPERDYRVLRRWKELPYGF